MQTTVYCACSSLQVPAMGLDASWCVPRDFGSSKYTDAVRAVRTWAADSWLG